MCINKLISYVLSVGIATFFIGCTGINQAARGVGRPVGSVLSVPQSVTEGVAQGYADGDRNENPYGR